MSRRKKNPLRPLTDVERDALTRLRRATAAPAVQVTRARLLLAVADGANYQDAARALGHRRESLRVASGAILVHGGSGPVRRACPSECR